MVNDEKRDDINQFKNKFNKYKINLHFEISQELYSLAETTLFSSEN